MGQAAALKPPQHTRPDLARRRLLALGAGLPLLAACRPEAAQYTGGWLGAGHERGHRLRDTPSGQPPRAKSGQPPSATRQRQATVLVVGAGVAGLACARALQQAGVDDVQLLELEDQPGGNSRGHQMGGMACPLGAHYLPLPDAHHPELSQLLLDLGLCEWQAGRLVYNERHLCHSPQERLYIANAEGRGWHDGLLPPVEALPEAEQASTLAQYRQFSRLVADWAPGSFTVPTQRARWQPALAALDQQRFAHWLDQQGLTAPALRWSLDYCCRDDYGAGLHRVSAWAGLHYFASRHGFHAPGEAPAEAGAGPLTWPEGNAWLSRRLAAPLQDRLHTGRVVLQVEAERHQAVVDCWDSQSGQVERWTCKQLVLATPLFISARLLRRAPDTGVQTALQRAAGEVPCAPWLVANLQLDRALVDLPGAAPAWDNVVYGGPALGYVDAMHQSTRPHPGPTVLTAYWALGGDSASAAAAQRRQLLERPWSDWAAQVVADLAGPHPDLPGKLQRVDLMRYGHAMAIPVPGLRSSAALQALAAAQQRVWFAHSDLSAHSVFEEAFFHGHRVGQAIARRQRGGRR